MSVARIRLKYVASLNDDVLAETTDPERRLRYIDISNVDSTGAIHDGETLVFEKAPSRARRLVRDGDVIVSTVRTYLRAIAPIKDPDPDLVVSTGFAVVRPRHGLDPHYASYALQDSSFVDRVVAHSEGVSYPAINPSKLACLDVPLPQLPAQHSIAHYLDSETARIGSLIDRKQRFIDLLLEKRTALITHAVTQGLDPNVEMKDSGVTWLGEVPVHWRVFSLRRVTTSCCDGPFGSGLKNDHYGDSGVRVVRLGNIGAIKFKDGDAAYVDAQHAATLGDHSVLAGDVLIAGLGDDRNMVGRACVAPELGPAMVKADCFRFRMNSWVAPAFMAYALSATAGAFSASASTGATRNRVNLSNMLSRPVALPPEPEQQSIVRLLDEATGKIDALVDKTTQSIDLLREYRTALISAAVTGQIDIPGTETTEEVA